MAGGSRLPSLIVFLLLVVLINDAVSTKRRVVILSFDGFRWDYMFRNYTTPNFQFLINTGSYAPLGVRPAFATKTFPDHYTLVTGLYEESHGIVSNRMWDPLFQESFTMSNTETKWWDGGEPIWITARLAGLKTAAFFWPGSEVTIRDTTATHVVKYNKSTPFKERVDTVVGWLVNDDVDLALSYFHEPDSAGHRYGVFTPQIEKAVEKADETLGYLLDKLRETNLLNSTDLLVLSDHGMANVTHDDQHLIVLSEYLDMEAEVERIPQDGTFAHILPKKGKVDVVHQKLVNAHPNMTVYKKEDIPERYHYKNHRRIMPILAIADEGYYITEKRDWSSASYGEHGYDNELKSMKPIFFARGPNFKQKHLIPMFDTVSVYPLVCHLLNIRPAPNNGSLAQLSDMLISSAAIPISVAVNYFYLPAIVHFIHRLSFWL